MFIYESFFIISPLIALILLFWYKTDFVLVYGKLFGLNNFLKITDYEISKKTNLDLKYYVFLAMRYKNFFVKLITCQICLSTWLSIVFTGAFCVFHSNFYYFLFVPFNIILGNLTYNLINKTL